VIAVHVEVAVGIESSSDPSVSRGGNTTELATARPV